jgi:hypothetical protein
MMAAPSPVQIAVPTAIGLGYPVAARVAVSNPAGGTRVVAGERVFLGAVGGARILAASYGLTFAGGHPVGNL